MDSDLVKKHLQKNTDECIEKKAFGAPYFEVDIDGKTEMFFGSDRFE